MYNSNEIGLDWKGSLETLSTIPRARCAILDDMGSLKDSKGNERCKMIIEDTVADNTLGKLVWVKRFVRNDSKTAIDLLVKKPVSQKHAKQEAVIQWLVHISLSEHGLGEHCPKVIDIFSYLESTWFSMEPIYSAPLFDTYLRSLPTWSKKSKENGHALINILAQIALSCIVLERTIGFNHRDLKPDNILVKLDSFKARSLKWSDQYDIHIAPHYTAILVDYGFSCLGPGKTPWIQSGDDVLPPFDPCPKIGRDIFMILVFLLWQKSVRDSLIDEHIEFFKKSLHLSTDRLAEMMNTNKNPSDWIYMLITERGFQCPALDPLTWLKSCATTFPEIVVFR
jgi:serine/threonine protein kinase